MLFIFTLSRITQLSFYVQRTASRKFNLFHLVWIKFVTIQFEKYYSKSSIH